MRQHLGRKKIRGLGKKRQGYAAIMAVFIFSIALILLAGIIDMGYLYVRKARLIAYARLGTRAAMDEISKKIIEAAERRIGEDGSSQPVSPIAVLTPEDREWVVGQAASIKEAALTIIEKNGELNTAGITRDNVTINFPNKFKLPCEDYPPGRALPLDIKITIKEERATIMSAAMLNTTSTSVMAISKRGVVFCP